MRRTARRRAASSQSIRRPLPSACRTVSSSRCQDSSAATWQCRASTHALRQAGDTEVDSRASNKIVPISTGCYVCAHALSTQQQTKNICVGKLMQ